MKKLDFIDFLNNHLEQKRTSIQDQIDDLAKSISEDTKSSSGDKHETSRSMAQLEQEKLGKQYIEAQKLVEHLGKLDTSDSKVAKPGSLISSSEGYYFIGIPLGKVDFNGETVFCISTISPFGKAILGVASNTSFAFQGRHVTIIEIF